MKFALFLALVGTPVLTAAQGSCSSPDAAQCERERVRSFAKRVERDLAAAYSAGLSDTAIRILRLDRSTKLAVFESDPVYRAQYNVGDSDGDLVPDERDRCRGTATLAPTDARGCGYDCNALSRDQSELVTRAVCVRAGIGRGARAVELGRLEPVEIPLDPKCVGAGRPPSAIAPLGWAESSETGPLQPWGTYTMVEFALFTTRSSSRKPGCSLFYEFELWFPDSGISSNVLFRASEDRSPNHADIATFKIPAYRSESVPASGPLWTATVSTTVSTVPSLGRKRVQDGLLRAPTLVHWRARTVDGLGRSYGWSEWRFHKQGPELTQ